MLRPMISPGIEHGADESLCRRLGPHEIDEEVGAVGQREHVKRLAIADHRNVDCHHGPLDDIAEYQPAERGSPRGKRCIPKRNVRQRNLAALPLDLHRPGQPLAHIGQLGTEGHVRIEDVLAFGVDDEEPATPPHPGRRAGRCVKGGPIALVDVLRSAQGAGDCFIERDLALHRQTQAASLVQQLGVRQVALRVPSGRRERNAQDHERQEDPGEQPAERSAETDIRNLTRYRIRPPRDGGQFVCGVNGRDGGGFSGMCRCRWIPGAVERSSCSRYRHVVGRGLRVCQCRAAIEEKPKRRCDARGPSDVADGLLRGAECLVVGVAGLAGRPVKASRAVRKRPAEQSHGDASTNPHKAYQGVDTHVL